PICILRRILRILLLFVTDTPSTNFYTLSLHDALPISPGVARFDYFRMLPKVLRGEYSKSELDAMHERFDIHFRDSPVWEARRSRSEEHTSELQSRENLVCRLLLEKKKNETNIFLRAR